MLTVMLIAGLIEGALVATVADAGSSTEIAAVIAGVFLILNTITMVVLTAFFSRRRVERVEVEAQPPEREL